MMLTKKKAKLNGFLTFFHQTEQSQKRGMKSEKKNFLAKKQNKEFRPFFRPHSQHAYLHYFFQFLVLYGTTSILRYNIGMANILQGCQKRFVFVS